MARRGSALGILSANRWTIGGLCLGLIAAAAGSSLFVSTARAQSEPSKVSEAIRLRAQVQGSVRVIVGLRTDWRPLGLASSQELEAQQDAIAAAQGQVLSAVLGSGGRLVRNFETIPFQALEVGPRGLAVLQSLPFVTSVLEDGLAQASLAQSSPLVQADQAWAAGRNGSTWGVAVLDTGIDKTHPFLAGKVVAEACFSANGSCPNGAATQIGAGAGVPCTYAAEGCDHGTHVAGIAAGTSASFSGVGRSASLLAYQVFSKFTGTPCGMGGDPCALSYTSDQIAALEHVFSLRNTHKIASVNMSLGGGRFFANCDAAQAATKAAIDNLRSAGIAAIIASGNDGYCDSISGPACISSAISVGSTTKSDGVSFFSNTASFQSLFAPGTSINSSLPGGGFGFKSGTSMATPHVAGAWAMLRQQRPTATVAQILQGLQTTGLPVTDVCAGVTKPRVRLKQALDNLLPALAIDDRSVLEGGATAAGFRVTLSAATEFDVTTNYATSPGTALAGSDYTTTSGTLTLTPGRITHSVAVPILADATPEGSETFSVLLSGASNAVIADGTALGTIGDPPGTAHVPMYRAYNPNAFYHFFTTSGGEFANAVSAGYVNESVPLPPFNVPNVQGTGKAGIHRMYNPNSGRHYYTANSAERDILMGIGWVYEKDEGFVYTSAQTGIAEVFKLYNNISGVHLYTVKPAEKDAILAQFPGIWFQHTSLGYAVP